MRISNYKNPFFLRSIDCDVGIAGGGISGLYMAYKLLVENKETKVCIFEQENRVGGRILDHRFGEAPEIYVRKFLIDVVQK